MQLLKRNRAANPSCVISIQSGVEEVQDAKVHEECDFLVDVLTGKSSVSPDFCCKVLYMILCTCFTTESRQKRSPAAIEQRRQPSTYQTI